MTEIAGTSCHLCGVGIGRAPVIEAFAGGPLAFCCHGCANVYAVLHESGMARTGVSLRDTDLFKRSLELGLVADQGSRPGPEAVPAGAATVEKLYQLTGLWCPSCSWLIEHALLRERGVVSAEVLFSSDLLKVRYATRYMRPSRIPERLATLGYGASEYTGEAAGHEAESRSLTLRLGAAAFLWLSVMTFGLAIYAGYFEATPVGIRRVLPFVLMALATPAVFYSAWPILRLAWRGARRGHVGTETLLALGILAAYGYSAAETFSGGDHLYFDAACAIVTLVLVGKFIERSARAKAWHAITLLYSLVPKKARVLVPGGEQFVPIDTLQRGQIVVVKAGERVPADGVVIDGRSHVDESVLTGKSTPIAKDVGSALACGSVNGDGVLHVCATRVGGEATMARIVRTVEEALSGRSAIQRTVDRVSRLFVPAVAVIAAATVAGWLAWGRAGAGEALMHGIAVLVIACPCALGIAAPLALAAAVGSASRRGIFVGDSRALEMLPRADVAILDKTGTVTEGQLSVLDVDVAHLPQLAAVERLSEHPLGRALARRAADAGVAVPDASDVEVVEGEGIRATVAGLRIAIGHRRSMPAIPAALDARARRWEGAGATVAFYAWNGETQGLVAFSDQLRADAADLVRRLHERRMRVLIVSGDSRVTTEWVAARVGADESRAEVSPDGKVEIVVGLQRAGKRVVMVGDAVNAAAALARAELGIALGSGTDVASTAAAVVLVQPDLSRVADAIDLGRRTIRIVRQNLFWAFACNVAGIALAAAGVLDPTVAAAGMVLSSAAVIGNSCRLTRW
jgi:P-type Cu2+ transporter